MVCGFAHCVCFSVLDLLSVSYLRDEIASPVPGYRPVFVVVHLTCSYMQGFGRWGYLDTECA